MKKRKNRLKEIYGLENLKKENWIKKKLSKVFSVNIQNMKSII